MATLIIHPCPLSEERRWIRLSQGEGLTVKHLALRAEAVTLGDQIINLLTALQDALNGLVQDDLGLVELLLDLEDGVGLLGVLVLCEVLLELGQGELRFASGPRGARVLGEELVDAVSRVNVDGVAWV